LLFNSLRFLIFFPLVLTLFYLIPKRFRWLMLLISSYYFYMCWKPEYIILIILSTVVDYIAGIKIFESKTKKKKRFWLFSSLFMNLGLLFAFKYFNFFNDSIRILLENFNLKWGIPDFSLLLPVGISFYTFQTLSYTIDVYKGKLKPQRHLGIFALYVSFFPQLVAGPIERATHLLPQFQRKVQFDYQRVVFGMRLILVGFFKKIVIADRLAFIVNPVYENPHDYTGFPLILATILFAFQIYCDFSGYSDIAIGTAKCMGFDLMQNFKRPYYSKSIREFWKRWHISLSTWFRDYFYIPLGGNRVSKIRLYRNLMLTFIISGLWHGANWTFIVWGALHGSYCIFETQVLDKIAFFKIRNSFSKYLYIVYTFILVDISWVFFRANSLSDALYILKNMFVGIFSQITNKDMLFNSLKNISKFQIVVGIFSIFILEILHLLDRDDSMLYRLEKVSPIYRWIIYVIFTLFTILMGEYGSQKFIYFQF